MKKQSKQLAIIKQILQVTSMVVLLSACASTGNNPSNKEKTQAEPVTLGKVSFSSLYSKFSCDQLESEAKRLAEQMNQLAQSYAADLENNRLVFFGSIIYWPILLINDAGTDPTIAAQYNQVEKRMQVLANEAATKGCAEQ